jgi:putative tricarboxylic transport membrane protein
VEIFDHIGAIFSISNLLVLVIATTGGLILGALPGLSPTMAVALLIPFTFQMDAATGLVLLGAVYTATVAGGAISGILVNIPGAPANIATVLDGHPMAKKGKATQALHFCFISSFVGGITGVLVLIFFTPPLAKLESVHSVLNPLLKVYSLACWAYGFPP